MKVFPPNKLVWLENTKQNSGEIFSAREQTDQKQITRLQKFDPDIEIECMSFQFILLLVSRHRPVHCHKPQSNNPNTISKAYRRFPFEMKSITSRISNFLWSNTCQTKDIFIHYTFIEQTEHVNGLTPACWTCSSSNFLLNRLLEYCKTFTCSWSNFLISGLLEYCKTFKDNQCLTLFPYCV